MRRSIRRSFEKPPKLCLLFVIQAGISNRAIVILKGFRTNGNKSVDLGFNGVAIDSKNFGDLLDRVALSAQQDGMSTDAGVMKGMGFPKRDEFVAGFIVLENREFTCRASHRIISRVCIRVDRRCRTMQAEKR